ncbi:MAG TPA: PAS domain S-box protein [Ktedonobacterales bacterium]|nr:PAS domain S-box protein [Ktedonobacterales bacterium]
MPANLQATLMQLFEQVQQDPDHMPEVLLDEWPVGSEEWRLLESFRGMAEQVQQRLQQLQQAEQQLREREEQYRSIFEAVTDGILIVDLEDCRLVEVNPAACRISGFTREEWLGQVIHTFDDTQQPPVHAHDVIKAGGLFHAKEAASGKDGKSPSVEIHVSPFAYKGRPHMLQIVRDITEQVEAEAQLREREEQYRSIFEAVTDGILIVDLEDCRLVEVNPAACRISGYSREEWLGHVMGIRDDSQNPPVHANEVVKAGGIFHMRDIIMRKDRKSPRVEVYASPFIYKGAPHMLEIVRDITEQAEAERQLREREALYRGIFETTYDMMMIFDLDGYVVEANPATYQMYGYPYEEIIGMHGSALMAPASQAAFNQTIELNRAGKTYQGVGRGLRKDGTTFLFNTQTCPITYRGQPHALAAARDITEQVEAERQLREREALYRGIFETTSDGLAIIDLEGHYVEVNPAVCQMFGYAREELIGQHVSARTAPASQHNTTRALSLLQAGGPYAHPTGTSPSLGVRKDGSVFPFEAHGSPITYRGQPHALIVGRDITEQVQATQLLEQRVQERTRELSALLEVSHNVASTLHLEPLLGLILEQLQGVVDCTSASVLTVEGDESVVVATRGPDAEQRRNAPRLRVNQGTIWEHLLRGEAVIIDDVRGDTPLAQDYRHVVGDLLETAFRHTHAWMGVPMTLKDQVSGLLSLSSSEVGVFTAHHATLAQAVANQAAIAIANARLYEQAQALAALEERQKLARELHDSVSQALYGIALGAHSARTALQRDPEHVAEPLDYVLSLAEAGLAEMRALIFELRPESLETEGLVAALSKQGKALQARHELTVHLDLCDEPALPLGVKQELYRIAQEAMHNTVKHARARRVDLRLYQTGEAVQLEVRDDGVGFDAQSSFPGHLGLHSMRERVSHLGGTLQIESAPGQGTRICVQVPLQPPA